MINLHIVTPVYNDWDSFIVLVERLESVLSKAGLSASIIVVDDCSHTTIRQQDMVNIQLRAIRTIELVRLGCNMGHQRAIAIGMALAAKRKEVSQVVVMDSDGEDRPEDVVALVERASEGDTGIVCAQRGKRSENLSFKLFYNFYKFLFLIMTGKVIDFGNFMIIDKNSLISLVYNPNLWNHLAAAVVHSRVPIERLNTHRGTRFSGQTKMNSVSLFIHGLSAISAFFDVFLVRLLCSLGVTMLCALFASIIVVLVRFFSDLAIPGWATNVLGFALVIFLISILVGALAVLGLLSNRSALQTVPIVDADRFIASTLMLIPQRDRDDR